VITLDGVELPEDMEWADEYTAWKVGQVLRPSLTGALIVQEAAMQAGRPVTLQSLELGGGRYAAAVALSVLDVLRAKEEVAGAAPMTLVLPIAAGGTRSMQVLWRRTDGPAIVARPLTYKVPAEPSDLFLITLRLIQV
jgi:hypothetical protein